MFYKISVLNKQCRPDQMPRSVASDIGLVRLLTTLFGVSRLKLVDKLAKL